MPEECRAGISCDFLLFCLRRVCVRLLAKIVMLDLFVCFIY